MKIKRSLIAVGVTLAVLSLAACGGTSDPLSEDSPAQPSEPSSAAAAPIVVGSADFTESMILAEIYSQAMKAKGVESSRRGMSASFTLATGQIRTPPSRTRISCQSCLNRPHFL